MYWHQFDSLAAHPTTWDSGLLSPGDRYERASYCVLSGESVDRALADSECNRKAAAEDSQDSARGYPEPDTGEIGAVDVEAKDPPAVRPAVGACPQPWCGFSLMRLRLSELEGR